MSSLNPRQQAILDYLLEHSEGATADTLADAIGVTKTAAKEHIKNLEYLGFVGFRDEKGFVGRPKRFYFLTAEGTESFPRQYSWLSTMLLTYLAKNLNPNEVTSMMKSLADTIATDLEPRLAARRDRMAEIVKVMNELGYKARLGTTTKAGETIEASNCVYHNVAKAHPALCAFDIRLLEKATKKSVKMESCIARGGSSCKFCVK